MAALMISLAKLIMGFIFVAAPLIYLIILLHVWGHRRSIMEGIVGKELNSPDLRGLVASYTKYALLSKSCRVEVDIWNCSSEQIWDVIDRLRTNLPSNARLVVNGIPARSLKTIFSLEIKRVSIPRHNQALYDCWRLKGT
jgi:hypothetical protein